MSRLEQHIPEIDEKEHKEEKYAAEPSLMDFIEEKYHFAFEIKNAETAAESIRIFNSLPRDVNRYINYIAPFSLAEKISLLLLLFNDDCRFDGLISFFTLLAKLWSDDAISLTATLMACKKMQDYYKIYPDYGSTNIFSSLFLFINPYGKCAFSGTKYIIKLLQESDQVNMILKSLRINSKSHEFLELFKKFTLDYSCPEMPLPAFAWETFNNHPVKFTPAFHSRDMLALMDKRYVTTWLKVLLGRDRPNLFANKTVEYFKEEDFISLKENYRDAGYEAWFFEIIRNFIAINLTEMLPFPAPLAKMVADYYEENDPQENYDHLLLDYHNKKSLLTLVFKYYNYPSVFQTEQPFSKILTNITASALKSKLREPEFTQLVLQQKNLFTHIQGYLQTKNQDLVSTYIGYFPDQKHVNTAERKPAGQTAAPFFASCATLLRVLASTDVLSEMALGDDYKKFCSILASLRKFTLPKNQQISEAELKAIDNDGIYFFIRVAKKNNSQEVLLNTLFDALFYRLTEKQLLGFIRNCDLKAMPSIVFIVMLRSIKSLDPLLQLSAVDAIFKRLSHRRITEKLVGVSAHEIHDLFKLYPPKIQPGRQGLIQQLDDYILRARKKNPQRVIQAIHAKTIIAYGSPQQSRTALLELIKEVQANHDSNRYRFLRTESRLIRILLDANDIIRVPVAQRSWCRKMQQLFTTANDRVYVLLEESKHTNTQSAVLR